MDIFKKLQDVQWTPLNVLKAAGVVLIAIVALSLVLSLTRPLVSTLSSGLNGFGISTPSAPVAQDGRYYASDDYAAEEAAYFDTKGGTTLSLNNIGIPPRPGQSTGDDAEDFEVTEYNASIETQSKEKTCAELSGLKVLDYVIFDSANEYDRGCSYTFKVKHENVAEILATVSALNPKDLSENVYTIKRQLDDFTSETEILESKLASIDQTLKNAVNAYDEITALATRTQNAEALAKIIDSKINIIERLTQERLNITAQLERLERGKAQQLDRLEYTYFYVNVYENKFVDLEGIQDSWKAAVKDFVYTLNRTLQDLTINLIAFLFVIAQYLLYFFIFLFIAKYLWKVTKYIWHK